MNRFCTGLLASLLPTTALGAELQPEAQVRPRWEADSGRDGVSGQGDVSTMTIRSRLGATLSEEDLSLRVVVSDVRVVGSQGHTILDHSADHLDLRIATATWSPGPWRFTVGRDSDSVHNERLLGATDWAQAARTFEGLRITRTGSSWTMGGRLLMLSESDALEPSAGFQAQDQPDVARDSLLAVVSGEGKVGGLTLQPAAYWRREVADAQRTIGGRAALESGRLRAAAELYHQSGRRLDAPLQAGMAHASVGWVGDGEARPSVTLWYDWLSGDRDPSDGTQSAFDTLYGTNHKFYGFLDIATFSQGGAVDGAGLQDAALKLKASPGEKWSVGVDLHALAAAVPGDQPLLALEPDLYTGMQLTPGLKLTGGLNLWLPPGPAPVVEHMAWAMLDARI
jgi:hypothetical protein